MYSNFEYASIPLEKISLDVKNPRLVTPKPLKKQEEILEYLYEHEDLDVFIKKISGEGRNIGAERPYVVKKGNGYTVVEGNTRIAAYKVLSGLMKPPSGHAASVPSISEENRKLLLDVECTIASSRDDLLPIMASAHFGLGDKTKWGYLGSRKAIYDEWASGRSIPQLAKAFRQTQGEIREFILEYKLYQAALACKWTKEEKARLLDPRVQFNPPVRFLQTQGHKNQVGLKYDKTNLEIQFENNEAKSKFRHLVNKLVVQAEKGLGATASYDEVFADYIPPKKSGTQSETTGAPGSGPSKMGGGGSAAGKGSGGPKGGKTKPTALFSYPATKNNTLLHQLMKEAKTINARSHPAAATFLLRNILETILREIIEEKNFNPDGKKLSLETAMNLCLSKAKNLPADDVKVIKDINNTHLDYLNMGAHGGLVPNFERVKTVRDSVDQFVKRNV